VHRSRKEKGKNELKHGEDRTDSDPIISRDSAYQRLRILANAVHAPIVINGPPPFAELAIVLAAA